MLFAFVRYWARRSVTGGDTIADQGRLVLVTEAVQSLERRGSSATVTDVSQEIGIDHSGASRLVARAVEAGHVSVRSSDEDARRREASVTPAGHAMLGQAHRWQEGIFDQLTHDWTRQRRLAFADAMTDLIDNSHELDP